MFTGLVETAGRVLSFRRTGDVYTLGIEPENKNLNFVPELVLGQSVSISGACLTVTAIHGRDSFDVDMMPETVTRTWFGAVGESLVGRRVNLERALRLCDRLDGHLVLGHVDGLAILRELTGNDQTRVAVFEIMNGEKSAGEISRGIVPKGSVALDGVSLTVIDAGATSFSVGLIPTTLTSCTLGDLKIGVAVNLETDVLGKYVERLLTGTSSGQRGSGTKSMSLSLTMEDLANLGY